MVRLMDTGVAVKYYKPCPYFDRHTNILWGVPCRIFAVHLTEEALIITIDHALIYDGIAFFP